MTNGQSLKKADHNECFVLLYKN